MTFHEAYERSKDWKRKITLVSLFHKTRLSRNRNWTIRMTARYFKVSVGLVSENLKLSSEWELIKDCSSRNVALKFLREK